MRSNRANIVVYIFLIITIPTGISQDLSPVNISVISNPHSMYNGSFSLNARAGLSLPIIRNSKIVFLLGGNYGLFRNINYSDSINSRYIFSVIFPFTLVYKLNEHYKLLASYEFGIGSDIVSFSHPGDYKHMLNFGLLHSNTEKTNWIVILQLYRQHGGLSISPNLYADIHLFNNVYFNGVLPLKPKITWKINADRQLGACIVADRNTFSLYEEKTTKYIEDVRADFDFFYQFRIADNFKLSASVGYTFLHSLKVYAEEEKVPVKVYIFDGSGKQSIKTEPKGFEFKLRLFYALSK